MTFALPPPALDAPHEILTAAREECANRVRESNPMLAASYLHGGEDEGWNIRHAVNRIKAERGK